MKYLIAARAKNGTIGMKGGIPWRLRDDMRQFAEKTKGHPVIMGKNTFESMSKRPLPGRQNVVVCNDPGYEAPGATVATSLQDAIDKAGSDPFFIGGSWIYREALEKDLVDVMYLTEVDAEIEGDTLFPEFDQTEWELVHSERHKKDEDNEYPFIVQTYERKR